MPSIGAPELIIVLVIVLLIFGGAKLPKLARSLGEAKTEFEKSSRSDAKNDAKNEAKKEVGRGGAGDGDEKVTMSKSELDALLAERELKAKRD
jgi:sec-independent protein translocase protein TatA